MQRRGEVPASRGLRLEDRDAAFVSEQGDFAPLDGAPATAGTIRSRHDADELVLSLEEGGEDRGAERGRPQEDDA